MFKVKWLGARIREVMGWYFEPITAIRRFIRNHFRKDRSHTETVDLPIAPGLTLSVKVTRVDSKCQDFGLPADTDDLCPTTSHCMACDLERQKRALDAARDAASEARRTKEMN